MATASSARRPRSLAFAASRPTLIVSQPELPATKLLFEDPVLLDQVGDNVLLMPMHPARNRQQEQLERESSGRHSAIVGALNSHAHRQLRTDPFFAQSGLMAMRPRFARESEARRWCADAGRPTRFKPSSPSPTDAVRDGSAKLGHPVQNVTREHGLTPLPR